MPVKTVLLGFLLLPLLSTPAPTSQYQYTEQANKDFHFRNRIQTLERQVETLKKEVKRLQAIPETQERGSY
jgi:hypothetical protein